MFSNPYLGGVPPDAIFTPRQGLPQKKDKRTTTETKTETKNQTRKPKRKQTHKSTRNNKTKSKKKQQKIPKNKQPENKGQF